MHYIYITSICLISLGICVVNDSGVGGETTAQELRVAEGIQYAYVPTAEPQTDEVQV